MKFLKKIYFFLIPFYIFSHENKFPKYNTNEEKLEELKEEYIKIRNYLDELSDKGEITMYIKKTIIEMSNKVLESLAKKYNKVREEVKSIMGGKILEYEAKTLFNQGREEGRNEEKKDTAFNLYQMGMKEDFIATAVNVSVELVRQWLGLVNG